jgi:hypothetical protein
MATKGSNAECMERSRVPLTRCPYKPQKRSWAAAFNQQPAKGAANPSPGGEVCWKFMETAGLGPSADFHMRVARVGDPFPTVREYTLMPPLL